MEIQHCTNFQPRTREFSMDYSEEAFKIMTSEAVGNLPVMPSLLPHVLLDRS
jgi:hypothetical protein